MGWLPVLLVVIAFIVAECIRKVDKSTCLVIERFGRFHSVAYEGLCIVIPFVDNIKAIINLNEQTMDFPPQGVITKDNVTIAVNIVVSYTITDPKLAVYGTDRLQKSVGYLLFTTLRDIVGKMDLDVAFSSRDLITDQLVTVLNETTDKWGCKINGVEIKDINMPKDIKEQLKNKLMMKEIKDIHLSGIK